MIGTATHSIAVTGQPVELTPLEFDLLGALVENAGHVLSMGLGLSIAYTLIAAHDGRLELDSTPRLGSHFTIWLPLQSPQF